MTLSVSRPSWVSVGSCSWGSTSAQDRWLTDTTNTIVVLRCFGGGKHGPDSKLACVQHSWQARLWTQGCTNIGG